MSKQSLAHENMKWTKHKLDEIDATLAALEDVAERLKGDVRKQADRAAARIEAERNAFKAKVDAALGNAAAVKGIADNAFARLQADWIDFELATRARGVLRWKIGFNYIRVKVQRGQVTLSGTVDSSFDREAAEQTVRKLSGVVGVTNRIVPGCLLLGRPKTPAH